MTNAQGKTISRQELYEAVWQTPISKLAIAWNVLPVGIVKACERMNVPRPEPGHWAMVQRGWEVTKEALPAAAPGTPASTTIGTPQRRTRAGRALAEGANRPQASAVKVPSDLRNAYPEVRKMQQHLTGGYADGSGLVNSLRRMRVLRVRVSEAQVGRALRIVDGMIKALEARGAKFVTVPESDMKEIRIDGEQIESVLIEETKRVRRETREDSPFAREWELRATGRLRFDIGQYTPVGGQKSWIDGERHSLEDQLGEIVERLFEVAAELKKWQADREAADRREREAWAQAQEAKRQEEERRKEAERRARIEEENRNRLVTMARNWREARVVRRFIRVCEGVLATGPAGEPWQEEWLTWAKGHADRMDPMTNGYLEAERRRLTAERLN